MYSLVLCPRGVYGSAHRADIFPSALLTERELLCMLCDIK